ncbi:MAG TPA: TilS substrate-binding domain-containing protein, partial [Mycobacteriales bacterium]
GRVLRGWLAPAGVPALTSAHLSAASALLVDWHGQGPVALPGGWQVCRRNGRLLVRPGVAPPVAGQEPDGG